MSASIFSKKENKFQKRPLIGGKKVGTFYFIGKVVNPEGMILISEGYSTGATVHESIDCPNVISFNCINLPHVAKAIRKLYPNAKIGITADRDSEGAGERYAKNAIDIVGGFYVSPDFSIIPADLYPEITRSDFNDLFCLLLKMGLSRENALNKIRYQVEIGKNNSTHGSDDMRNNAAQAEDSDDTNNVRWIKHTIKKAEYPEFTLDRYGKNKPLNTYGNLKYMLDRFGIIVRWNAMSHIREVIMPESESKLFLDDAENSALREITNMAELNYMPTTKIDDHLTTLAQQNSYHPITECIKSKPWDNIERLNKFIATITTTNNEFSHKLIRRWMISAIAAAFSENGFASQGVLVLQGKQNIGKTRWVKSLDPINCGAVKEGAILDPSNKDSVITSSSHWITELGELDATFRRADMARLKSHITNQIDILRFHYARKNSRLPRRSVFVATVNESQYLIDDTGNRRWWTIEVLKIDLEHDLDMQQVWAEAYYYWKNGEQHWLTIDELNSLNKTNTEHEQLDPFEEKVLAFFNWDDPDWRRHNTSCMTATNVLEVLGYKLTPNDKQSPTRMGKILMKLTGVKPVRKDKGRYHTLPRYRC